MCKLTVFLLCCLVASISANKVEVDIVMRLLGVIPDVLDKAPQEFLKVDYGNGVHADRGNILTPTQTKEEPELEWTTDPDAYYTILMTTPDTPSRFNPKFREYLHWLVVNVPGGDVDMGDVIDPYLGPAPRKYRGFLRYVLLVYKQPKKLQFDEPILNNTSVAGHRHFSTRKFAKKYDLDPLIAGNVFQSSWDEWSSTIHKQLGLDFDEDMN